MYKIWVCNNIMYPMMMLSNQIEEILAELNITAEIQSFSSLEELCQNICDNQDNAVFLDLEMPGTDEFAFAKALKDKCININVIFVSCRQDLIFSGSDMQYIYLVRKSHLDSDLKKIILKLYYLSIKKGIDFIFKSNQYCKIFNSNDIIYIECIGGNYVNMITSDKETCCMRFTMNELEQGLKEYGFVRINKSFIANEKSFSEITGNKLTLNNGRIITIGRKYIEHIKSKYSELNYNN